MNNLTIDNQLVSQTCDHCKAEFDVSRGSIYKTGMPVGLYLAAMHCCQSKLVFLAVAVGENWDVNSKIVCFLLNIWPTLAEIQMAVTDPDESPWAGEAYMGDMLTRDAALNHPMLQAAFEIADLVTMNNPVSGYLAVQ